jgi:flagellar motor switch protein FliG
MSQINTVLLTPAQKTAVVMMLVGEDEAASLLKSLSPEDVDAVGSAMMTLPEVNRPTAMQVLADFAQRAADATHIQPASELHVSTLLTTALGETHAQNALERVMPLANTRAVRQLAWLGNRNLAQIIGEEHPQVIAVMLSLLTPAQAATVATHLPPEQQVDVLLRMSRLKKVRKEALSMLESALNRRIAVQANTSPALIDGRQQVVSLLKAMTQSDNRAVLQALSAADSTLADAIQEEMFIFANLADLSAKHLQSLVSRIEGNLLAVALKGAPDPLCATILGCMSARAAATISDEMDSRGTLRPAEIAAAQKSVLQMARQMADAGEISMETTGASNA